jgi:hypothetical protein
LTHHPRPAIIAPMSDPDRTETKEPPAETEEAPATPAEREEAVEALRPGALPEGRHAMRAK